MGVSCKPKSGRYVYRHNNYPFLTAFLELHHYDFGTQVGHVFTYFLQVCALVHISRTGCPIYFRKGPQPLMWADSQAARVQLTERGILTTGAAGSTPLF